MSKDIIDYLHFYLGCEVIGTYNDQSGSKGTLTGVTNGGHECEIQFLLEDGINVSEEPEYNLISDVKPILRKLESMTEEDVKGFASAYGLKDFTIVKGNCHGNFIQMEYLQKGAEYTDYIHWYVHQLSSAAFHYLLTRGFDLFGLIDAGLAIDKETLK